jgi:hypothetical protein
MSVSVRCLLFVVVDDAKLCLIWDIGNFFGKNFWVEIGIFLHLQSNQRITRKNFFAENRYLIGIVPEIFANFARNVKQQSLSRQ